MVNVRTTDGYERMEIGRVQWARYPVIFDASRPNDAMWTYGEGASCVRDSYVGRVRGAFLRRDTISDWVAKTKEHMYFEISEQEYRKRLSHRDITIALETLQP